MHHAHGICQGWAHARVLRAGARVLRPDARGSEGQLQGVFRPGTRGLQNMTLTRHNCTPELAMATACTDGFKLLFFLLLHPAALLPSADVAMAEPFKALAELMLLGDSSPAAG